jgi:capsule polysaccharide export protein KpsE/RkpR
MNICVHNTNFFFFIFLFLTIPHTFAYYSLWDQDIFIEKNDHVLINTTQLNGLVSDHILQTSGDIKITLVIIILYMRSSHSLYLEIFK